MPIKALPSPQARKTSTISVSRMSSPFLFTSRLTRYPYSGLAYQPDRIKQFLIAAHAAYFKKADKEILIFHPS